MDLEVTRKALHAAVAIIAVPGLLLVPLWIAVGLSALGTIVVMTTWWIDTRGRRHQVPGPVKPFHEGIEIALEKTMRHDEPFPWAALYYIMGLLLVALASDVLAVPLSIAFASYAVLGVGDSASALIGRAYGTHKIPWNPDKSWQGTAAGIGAGYPTAVLLASVFYWSIGAQFPPMMALVILLGTVAGMLFESLPLEDNFAIPVGSWMVMVPLAWVFGLL